LVGVVLPRRADAFNEREFIRIVYGHRECKSR
jgi:hypothetical protein